jgi:hypothetical protein
MAKSKSPRKAYQPKRISSHMANKIIYSTIFRASTEPISQDQITALILPFRAAIDALQRGAMDLENWTRLNEMNLFSFHLAGRLYKAAVQDFAKDQIAASQPTFEAAADALYQIGLRWKSRNRFVATGDELKPIKESANWLDDLLQIAPEGMALDALLAAEKDIDNFWRKQA